MPEDVTDKISERVLREEQNLVLVAYENTQRVDNIPNIRVGQGAFFKVRQILDVFKYGPLELIKEDGTKAGPISSNSGVDYQRLWRAADEDLFENEAPWVLHHYSLSVQQENIRIYPRIPNNQYMGGFTWPVAGEPDPTAGDKYGYIAGYEMEYDDPPAALEMVNWKTGDSESTSDIEYGFYNEDSEKEIDPILQIKGRAYAVEPITDSNRQKSLLLGNQPRTMVSIGPVVRAADIDWPNEWDDYGAVMNIQERITRRGR